MKAERLAVAAFFLAVVGGLVAAFAPIGRVMESSGSAGGEVVMRSYDVSLFRTDGAWVLVVVSVPVLVALVAILVRRRGARVVSAVLLWMGCVVGVFSVGMFFVPAAIAMTVAAARREAPPWSRRCLPVPPG